MRLTLILTLLFAPPLAKAPLIPLKVEASTGLVQPFLPVHITLRRVDGLEVKLPMSDVLQCTATGSALRCDGIDYKIYGVTFEADHNE